VWTSPITWSAAVVTATLWDVQVRDNFDSLYGPPRVKAVATRNQSMQGNSVFQLFEFDDTRYDTDGMHGGVTTDNEPEAALFTARTTGVYLANTTISFEWVTLGSREVTMSVRTVGNNNVNVRGRASIAFHGIVRNLVPATALYRASSADSVQFVVGVKMNQDTTNQDKSDSLVAFYEPAGAVGVGVPYHSAIWVGGV
jgi:hypothetical protein